MTKAESTGVPVSGVATLVCEVLREARSREFHKRFLLKKALDAPQTYTE